MIATVLLAMEQLEDPLAYLPASRVVAYRKGQLIYGEDQPCAGIYLLIDGKVKVSRHIGGHQVIVDIYQTDEFFGESALLNLEHHSDRATAVENVKLMTWSTSDIEDIVMKRPRLAVALLQIMTQRTIDFAHRIESFSADNIERRLARCLIRFSERFGTREPDGSLRMAPLTHEFLSQYIGTSREIITSYMNRFRREGFLRYSRKAISVYHDAFCNWLRQNPEAGTYGLSRSRHAGTGSDADSGV
jgi:CRP/FNR family transcriptional regulator, cyclic AMP receptor protein